MSKPDFRPGDHSHIWLFRSVDQMAFMDDDELSSWATVWQKEGNQVTSSPGKSKVSFDTTNGDSIGIAEIVYCSATDQDVSI